MAWPSFRFKPNDIFNTTLDGVITGATDPIPVIDNTDAEDGPGLIALENEIVKYTTKGSNEFSGLTRGYNSTTAVGHASGVAVTHPISADLIAKLTDAVEALYAGALDIVTTKGDILVASAADTLARLGIGSANDLLYINTDTPGWSDIDSLGILDKTTAQTIASVKTFDEGAIIHAPKAYTPAGAATATLNLTLGNVHDITMPAGNITIAISNEVNGQHFTVSILQDGVGSRTVTWFSTIKWAGGSAPTLTTTASKRDLFGFRVTGTDTYDGFVIGQNI